MLRSALARSASKLAAVGMTVTVQRQKHDNGRPAHHANDAGTLFENPWPSFSATNGFFAAIRMRVVDWQSRPLPPKEELPKVVKPDWGKTGDQSTYDSDIKATWLGHACFLVEFPSSTPGQRGYRVLFDPVFEDKCSPSQLVGPSRFTPAPLPLKDLPHIDAVVISHAHYDHLSLPTVQYLNKRANSSAKSVTSLADTTSTHFFAPLGNKKWFEANGIAKEDCSELDWWDQAVLQVGGETEKYKLRLTATPCQHFANRGLFDQNKTLWAGWAVEQIDQREKTNCKVFFGGDTAYKGRPRNLKPEDEENLPYCPAFKEVGQKFGGFDFSMLPIGAYSPKWFMSQIHANPEDAVRIHEDVKSLKSVGMHFACWILTDEPINEPKERLEACTKAKGMPADEFSTVEAIGATVRTAPKQW